MYVVFVVAADWTLPSGIVLAEMLLFLNYYYCSHNNPGIAGSPSKCGRDIDSQGSFNKVPARNFRVV